MHITNFEAETHHFILSFLSGTFDDVQKYFFPLIVIPEKRVNFETLLGVVFPMQHKVQRKSQTAKKLLLLPKRLMWPNGIRPSKKWPILKKGLACVL